MFSSGHQAMLPASTVSSIVSKLATLSTTTATSISHSFSSEPFKYGFLRRRRRRWMREKSLTISSVQKKEAHGSSYEAAEVEATAFAHVSPSTAIPSSSTTAGAAMQTSCSHNTDSTFSVASLIDRLSQTYADVAVATHNVTTSSSNAAVVMECAKFLQRTVRQFLMQFGDGPATLEQTVAAAAVTSDAVDRAATTPTMAAVELQLHAAFSTPRLLHNILRWQKQHSPLVKQTLHQQLHATFYAALNNSDISASATIYHRQRRGFKTRSSSGRLQSTSIKDEHRASDDSFFRRFMRDYIKQEKLDGVAGASSSELILDDSARKKYLKGDPRLTEEEQDRVKLAFLEGLVNSKLNAAGTTSGGEHTGEIPKKAILRAARGFLTMLVMVGCILVLLTLLSNVVSMRQLMGMSQHEVIAENVEVSFDDVRGCDEAKDELREIVEYLRNPEKFSALGGRLPKGVLLIGPPGTGKTLLGRAVAGEAGVPFFHVAGSEFDEILVGQGARRVRDLFTAAKEKSPCVIFIDEIDAVGSKRSSSVMHPHANQTINQLLAEMDGFHQNEGVIVLGATNRREDLDRALTRPGRFDIEVHVPVPDLKGRTDIINYYLAKIRIASDVNAETLARGTTGFTGADLESMINQAALKGASDGCTEVRMEYIEHARDRVLMGPARKYRIPDEEANKMTAFHEAGHTLVAYFTEHAMPLHKVTIIPRGMSLGHTAYIPEKENYQTTRAQMLAMLDTLMGGRAAEELIFGEKGVTSGAADDLRKASDMVRQMVKHFGMSDRVGLRFFHSETEEGGGLIALPDVSPATQDVIDQEIRRFLQESYERAKGILVKHAKEHKALADALMLHETLDASQVKLIVEGRGANMPKLKRVS